MLANTDPGRARDALHAIPPDLSREEWVRAGMAAQAAGLGFEDFDAWSAQAGNYDPRAARDTWRSFKPGKGVSAGTLYRMAAELGGWSLRGPKPAPRPAPTPRKVAELPPTPAPGMSPAELWNRFEPATDAHGYVIAKRGRPEGLRVVPEGDPLRVAGLSMAGALVVPVLALAGGEPSSLQLIAPPELAAQWKAAGKPSKLNLPGAPVTGTFIVGELVPGGVAYVVEGIGQAWACWQATGCPAVVAFGWGRVRSVAAELRQRDPSARLVLVPDAGKEGDAATIAQEVGAAVATMPEGSPRNFDANDYAQAEGFDALEALLTGASEPPKPEPRFKLLGAAELRDLPPLAWLVRGVLPAVGLAALYGPSASGKSFLCFDLAAAVAEGRRWFGCRVEAAPVVYVALEGEAGFRLRAAAWEQAQARPVPDALCLVLQGFKLTEPKDVQDLAAVVPTGAVVFLDTLNRAAPTADENSSRDMGEILEAAKRLQSLTAGLVVLVHHTGKDTARGLRGHSSLFAAMDACIEVNRDGDRREWRVAKSKDGSDGDAQDFRLDVVTLGEDEHGDEITSCVVKPDTATQEVQRVKMPQGGNQRLVLEALRPMFKDGRTGRPGAPPLRPCIELEAAVTAGAGRLTCPTDKRNTRSRDAITGLVSRGVVGLNEGWLWLV
jgi:putative DNA primase/helicase